MTKAINKANRIAEALQNAIPILAPYRPTGWTDFREPWDRSWRGGIFVKAPARMPYRAKALFGSESDADSAARALGESGRPAEVSKQMVFWRVSFNLIGTPLVTPEGRPKNLAALALSKLGASKGGQARAEALSPRRRKMIAKKAAAARWNKS